MVTARLDVDRRAGRRQPIEELETISSTPFVLVQRGRWGERRVLAKSLTDAGSVAAGMAARFEREGDVSERLDHPNTARLLRREPGLLVYEYVEGRTLADVLADGRPGPARALEIARGLLGPVAHAHGRGIIHLDIKPANVLIEPCGRVRVVDFGCAKDLTLAAITELDARLGTPHYMAPEQFRGTRDDPRSDVYSVGAVLYETLVGRPPFAHDPFGWLAGRAGPPDEWPDNPRVARVLRTALQRHPGDRYADALAMLAALEACED